MIRRVVENAAVWTALIVGSWAIAYTAVYAICFALFN